MTNLILPAVEPHWIELVVRSCIVIGLLWLLRTLVFLIKHRTRLEKVFRKTLPLADAMGMMVILFSVASILFRDQSELRIVFAIVVFVFVLWVLRHVFLDIVAGIVLRFENAFVPGEIIDFGEGNGAISKIRLRCLDVLMDKGRQVSIPYSKLAAVTLVKPSSNRPVKSNIFEIEIPRTAGVSVSESRIKSLIMSQPWSAVSVKPVIEPLEETSDHYRFKVIIHALELEHLAEIEYALRKHYAAGQPTATSS